MQSAKLHFSQAENNYQIKEAYKTLRSNVEFSGQNVRVISVTSCTPGEGKTTVAMALARAFTTEPDILFADEPTGDLDDENTAVVLSALHQFATEEGKIVFLVTHEDDASRIADRIFKMDAGVLTD